MAANAPTVAVASSTSRTAEAAPPSRGPARGEQRRRGRGRRRPTPGDRGSGDRVQPDDDDPGRDPDQRRHGRDQRVNAPAIRRVGDRRDRRDRGAAARRRSRAATISTSNISRRALTPATTPLLRVACRARAASDRHDRGDARPRPSRRPRPRRRSPVGRACPPARARSRRSAAIAAAGSAISSPSSEHGTDAPARPTRRGTARATSSRGGGVRRAPRSGRASPIATSAGPSATTVTSDDAASHRARWPSRIGSMPVRSADVVGRGDVGRRVQDAGVAGSR